MAPALGQTRRQTYPRGRQRAPKPAPFTTPLGLQTVTLATNLSAASRAPAGPGRGARSLEPPPPGPAPRARPAPAAPARAPIGPRPRPVPSSVAGSGSGGRRGASPPVGGKPPTLAGIGPRDGARRPPRCAPGPFRPRRWVPDCWHREWLEAGASGRTDSAALVRLSSGHLGSPGGRVGMTRIPSAATRKRRSLAGWY